MDTATLPIIYVYSDNLIHFITKPEKLTRIKASYWINKVYEHVGYVYDNAGNKWTFSVSPVTFKSTVLSRLLAKTVYNPFIHVNIHWKWEGNYELPEIKEKVLEYVKKDKGIVTQMVGIDLLSSNIEYAEKLEDIAKFFENYTFNVTMADYARELEHNQNINRRSRI